MRTLRHRFPRVSQPLSPSKEMMKKKTVITTEKREVWVIRRPSAEKTERDIDGDETESSATALISLLDKLGETAAQTNNEEEREFTEGEFDHVS
jgi:hypothetical protein